MAYVRGKRGRKSPHSEEGSGREHRRDAREKAMNLLLYRPRSEYELRTRLTDAGYSPDETEDALDYVKGYGYVNDRRFAENYARSRQDSVSRRVIGMELREKGVDSSLISDALEELDIPEEEVLGRLLLKKAGQPHQMEEKELRRLYGFLTRKGFSGGAIRRAVCCYEEEAEAAT